MFRDQSQQLIARSHANSQGRSPGSSKISTPQTSQFNIAGIDTTWAQPTANAPAMLYAPAVDQETAWIDFFVNQYTCSGTTDSKANMFWIPPNFHDMLRDDSLRFSVQSVGAMAIARLQKSQPGVEEAQKKYGQALLSLANGWGQVVSNAQKDIVFLVILLLGFFEVLATYGPSARKSWITHLGGVSVLFKNNEDYYCGTPFGARMFFHARSQMILIALQTKTTVADTFAKPNPRVLRAVPPQLKEIFEADILLIHLADLQARCRTSRPSISLLVELTGLGTACAQWAVSLPEFWRYTTQGISRPTSAWWDSQLHAYKSPILEHTWNKVRAALLVIHDLIRDLNRSLYPVQDAWSPFETQVQQLVLDICSSVPLRFRPTATSNTGTLPPLGTIYWLLWPLDVVGSMREAPLEMRQWVIQVFEQIHDKTGNIRANTLANKLKAGQRSFDVSLSYPSLLGLEK
ncbi:hypothetical protein PRZ48_003429 [Zasmidium cellare]|uniref:Uncharacterized protein n=1 Tax=Zasmidium cellare TaxID=395010 RepID=A0ABR0EWA2_ZASCE|nr:hypothetical protein PRZ48_003429 [Zasmidium cellare]